MMVLVKFINYLYNNTGKKNNQLKQHYNIMDSIIH